MAGVIRAADLFCGAGGSSTGLRRVADALGARLDLTAVNHWPTAVETHAANHPEARHVCENLDGIDARKVTGGKDASVPSQPFLLAASTWIEVRDGDPTARALFHRHYSHKPYRDGRNPKLFVGPGEKAVLLTPCARALFVWRRFISGDGQRGVNCAVFRNEGAGLSSHLIGAACTFARDRWPGEDRHYTYVNARRVQSSNPGFCFIKAGWRKCGTTKHRRLVILERVFEVAA